jgi:hypothetical protein
VNILERSTTMSKSLIARPTLMVAGTLLLAALASVYSVEAAAQGVTGSGVVDAHDQARRLLQQPGIAASPTTTVSTLVGGARSAVPDAQEQARRLLSHPTAGTVEAAASEGVTQILKLEKTDAHTLAELLLTKPSGY